MIFNGWQIASSVVLMIGSVSIVVSLFTSYWNFYHAQIKVNQGVQDLKVSGHRGLIWFCANENMEYIHGGQYCINRFKNFDNSVKPGFNVLTENLNYQPWEMAAMILLALSTAFGFGALFSAPLCCHKCGIIHSLFVYFAALCAILGIGVYAGFQLNSAMTQSTQLMRFDRFGWSFGVAIVGVIFQFAAAVLYTVSACCCSDNGYMKGRHTDV